MKCELCLFRCGADRYSASGKCGIDNRIHVAHYGLHTGEEPFLTGSHGSGTIFFAGCTLRCSFCQNHQISRWRVNNRCIDASTVTVEALADIFFVLKKTGAANINLVSPTPYVPAIIEAAKLAKSRGFDLPLVYNTHGYDAPETIGMLAGTIDIYLPDFKYSTDLLGKELSGAPHMYSSGRDTIRRMYSQAGLLVTGADGLASKGLAVRHLVLPGNIENSLGVLDFLETVNRQIHISLMSQFHPCGKGLPGHPELGRTLYVEEYERVVRYAESLGFSNLLVQEMESHSCYLPDFKRKDVFED